MEEESISKMEFFIYLFFPKLCMGLDSDARVDLLLVRMRQAYTAFYN